MLALPNLLEFLFHATITPSLVRGVLRLRRVFAFTAVAGLISLLACQNYSNTVAGTSSTKIKSRVLVSNQLASLGSASGTLVVVDADRDQVGVASSGLSSTGQIVTNPAVIQVGGLPTLLLLSPDRKTSLVFDLQSTNFIVVDNATEAPTASIAIGSAVTSAVLLSDNKTGYAALRNTGQVDFFDYTTFAVTKSIPVPTVRTLVLNHKGDHLLAFSDDVNSLAVIDTSANTATTINSVTFDRPVFGVFSSDDSKAYILSCGRECGGATARVSVLDMASGTVSASVPVSAATVGYLNSSGNLYVAGTQGTAGKLDIVAVSGLTVSKSGIPISDGFHTLIVPASNNRVFIGARTCSNVTTGCLTIFNTSASTAVIGGPKGDVTAALPITGRNIVYVAEGGELRIYDTTKDAETNGVAAAPIDIVGKAIDLKAIDQQ